MLKDERIIFILKKWNTNNQNWIHTTIISNIDNNKCKRNKQLELWHLFLHEILIAINVRETNKTKYWY